MATTQNTYTGNGSTTDYSITFEYLKDADVKVTLDHVATTAFTLPNATTLRFNTAPGNNVAIRIFRDTDVDAARFVYSAGSAIKAAELNENADQALYGLQETVNTDDITDAAVTTAKLRDGAVTTAKFGDVAITTAKIADSAVTTAKIAADAVNGTKIADDSINSEHYVDGSIDTAHIADAQITTAKIADDAVTADKLANTAVTAGSYTAADITVDAQGRVTAASSGAIGTAEITDSAVTTAKIADANVTTAKIADSAVTTAKIADAELVELATMGGNTASALADLTQSEVQILDGATVTTAELNILDGVTATATELNQLDGNTLKTTSTDFTSSSQFPAASEIDARITARIDPLGGFEAIADEDSFPATAPPAGTVISIANANGLAVNGSGVGAGTRAGGSDAVVINGFPSEFNSTSLDNGIGLLVIATSTAHTYDFHRVVAKNEDVRQLSSDINDFKARYRVGSSNPTTDNDAGDLFFNTSTSKMLVYDAGDSAWEEVQSIGEFFINTISSSSGTGGGSATFNNNAYRFTLSNAPTNAQQLLVSINGVVQKPNSGTSQPSEGFALDGSDIILAAAPASGADFFIITIGSTVNIGTPSAGTVGTTQLADIGVTTAKIAADAVTGAKIADDAIDSEHYVDGSIDTAHIADDAVSAAKLADTSVTAGSYGSATAIPAITVDAQGRITAASTNSISQVGGSNGVDFNDDVKARFGTGNDLEIYHDGNNSFIKDTGTGRLTISTSQLQLTNAADSEVMIKATQDAATELYHNGNKKLETTSDGISVTGEVVASGMGQFKGAEGASALLYLYADEGDDNSDKFRIEVEDGGPFKIQDFASGGWQTNIKCTGNDAVELYYNNNLKLKTQSNGIMIGASNTTYNEVANQSNTAKMHISGGGSGSGNIEVFGSNHSSNSKEIHMNTNNVQRMRIDANGFVNIGGHTLPSSTPGMQIKGNGNLIFCVRGDTGEVLSFHANTSSKVGNIVANASSTTYNTSSDYRLKENVVNLSGAIDRVKQLLPKRFNFIVEPDTTVDGFLAHEAQTVVPEAITGTHNEVDDNNNPVYQGIDQSKLVPLLTAALQEAIAKIETLETQHASLEARLTALEGGS